MLLSNQTVQTNWLLNRGFLYVVQVGFLKRISLQRLDTVAVAYFSLILLPALSLVLRCFYIPLTKHTKLNLWDFFESSLLVSVFFIGLPFLKKNPYLKLLIEALILMKILKRHFCGNKYLLINYILEFSLTCHSLWFFFPRITGGKRYVYFYSTRYK